MKFKNSGKILFVTGIILAIIFQANITYSQAETSTLIEPAPICNFKYYYSAVLVTMGGATCEYYYVVAYHTEFTEYNASLFRLRQLYNGRVMAPYPDINYSDSEYDWKTIINYYQFPSNWTECYLAVVCVNESTDLWSYPVLSQKIFIPDGLEAPDPDPVDPDPVPIDPYPTLSEPSPSFKDLLPIFIMVAIGLGIILLAGVSNYIITNFSFTLPSFRRRKSENHDSSTLQSEPKKKLFIIIKKIIFYPKTYAILIYQRINFHRIYCFFSDLGDIMLKLFIYLFKIVFFPFFILKTIYQKFKSYQISKKNNWQLFQDKINKDIKSCIWELSEPKNQLYNGLMDLKHLKIKMMEYKLKRVLYFFGNYVNNSEFDVLLKKIEKAERFYPLCKNILKINESYSKKIPANSSDKDLLPIEEKYLVFLREITDIFYRNGFNISKFSGIMTLKSRIDKRKQKIINLICNKSKIDFIENDIGVYFPDTNFFRSLHDYSFDYYSLKDKWDFLIENNYEMRKIDKSDMKKYLKKGKMEKIVCNFKFLKDNKVVKEYMDNVKVLLLDAKGRRKFSSILHPYYRKIKNKKKIPKPTN